MNSKDALSSMSLNRVKMTPPHGGASQHTLSATWWRSWQRLPTTSWLSIGHVWLALLALAISIANATTIAHDHTPNSIVTAGELETQHFHGNHTHVDYFRLLQRDGDSLLIGARNIVFNISIYDLSEHRDRRIVWYSKQKDSDMCFFKGKSEAECQNYIRVLAKKEEGQFLVCGTNAYKPLCRDYTLDAQNNTFTYVETSGVGKCPYNPRHNSTFVFADGELYSGTVADFQELVPLIFKEPLKTDHTDTAHLNAPSFVHSFSHGDYVFFFFRETAVEYMNCGKRVFSRVARVCKNDRGGREQKFNILWTSFLKSRLNCSFPGEFPFYFDEIQSVSDVIEGNYEGTAHEMIYAVFTTPHNSIPGSAICAFSMRDILDSFEGPYKEQKDRNSNWLSVPPHKVPEPRPGSCVNDSRTLPEDVVDFARSHPLMDELVPTFSGKPLLMRASFKYRFTKLAVDPQVKLADGSRVDVIFVSTDTGVIYKTVNRHTSSTEEYSGPVIIEEIQAFTAAVAINNLQMAKLSNGQSKLVVITDSDVLGIPVQRCHRANSCMECVELQDPYCGWSPAQNMCDSVHNMSEQQVYQNVSSGFHSKCPVDVYYPLEASTLYARNTEPSASVEPETCPPCICTEQVTPIPDTDKIIVTSETINPLKEISDVPPTSENEIESRQRSLDINDDSLVNEIVRHVASEGKTLVQAPPTAQKQETFREKVQALQEISIAYSEGETTITGPVVGASMDRPLIYSAETMAVAITTAVVVALVVGFILGFLWARKVAKDEFPPFSETPYLDSKLNKCDNLMPCADPNMYTANNIPKHINNLMPTYNPKDVNNERKANTTADNTLVKQAKCAYI